MYSVSPCFYVPISIVLRNKNINGFTAFTYIERPVPGFDFLDRLLLALLPATAVRIHATNVLDTFVRVLAISLVDTANSCGVSNSIPKAGLRYFGLEVSGSNMSRPRLDSAPPLA